MRTSTLVGLVRADLFDLPLLNQAQDADLQLQRHLADFVQQDGAAVGHLDFALLVSQRAGERTLHVTEQLRFQQLPAEWRRN